LAPGRLQPFLLRRHVHRRAIVLPHAPHFLFFCTAGSNIFFYVGTFIAERLLYLPSIGYCMFAAFVIMRVPLYLHLILCRLTSTPPPTTASTTTPTSTQTSTPASPSSSRRVRCSRALASLVSLVVAGALIAAGTWRTHTRNVDWTSEDRLFRAAYDVCPNSVKVLQNMGILARRDQHHDEAVEYFKTAMRIVPSFCEPTYQLALCALNRVPQNVYPAIEYLKQSLDCKHARNNAAQTLQTVFMQLFNLPTANGKQNLTLVEEWGDIMTRVEQPVGAINHYIQVGTARANAKDDVAAALVFLKARKVILDGVAAGDGNFTAPARLSLKNALLAHGLPIASPSPVLAQQVNATSVSAPSVSPSDEASVDVDGGDDDVNVEIGGSADARAASTDAADAVAAAAAAELHALLLSSGALPLSSEPPSSSLSSSSTSSSLTSSSSMATSADTIASLRRRLRVDENMSGGFGKKDDIALLETLRRNRRIVKERADERADAAKKRQNAAQQTEAAAVAADTAQLDALQAEAAQEQRRLQNAVSKKTNKKRTKTKKKMTKKKKNKKRKEVRKKRKGGGAERRGKKKRRGRRQRRTKRSRRSKRTSTKRTKRSKRGASSGRRAGASLQKEAAATKRLYEKRVAAVNARGDARRAAAEAALMAAHTADQQGLDDDLGAVGVIDARAAALLPTPFDFPSGSAQITRELMQMVTRRQTALQSAAAAHVEMSKQAQEEMNANADAGDGYADDALSVASRTCTVWFWLARTLAQLELDDGAMPAAVAAAADGVGAVELAIDSLQCPLYGRWCECSCDVHLCSLHAARAKAHDQYATLHTTAPHAVNMLAQMLAGGAASRNNNMAGDDFAVFAAMLTTPRTLGGALIPEASSALAHATTTVAAAAAAAAAAGHDLHAAASGFLLAGALQAAGTGVGRASALVTFICVLCTLCTQLLTINIYATPFL
jgi:hypothetical protein